MQAVLGYEGSTAPPRAGEVRQNAVAALVYGNERWDGGGYPEGRRGADIPRVARAFAVCRRWDPASHNGDSVADLRRPRRARAGPEDGPAVHGDAARREGRPQLGPLDSQPAACAHAAANLPYSPHGQRTPSPTQEAAAQATPDRHTRRRIIAAVIAAVVVLVLAFGSRILGMYVDWLWFGEVGFRGVFWTRIWWQVLVGVAAFAIFFIIVEFNVELARRLAPSYRVTAAGDLLEPRSDRVRRWVGWGGLGVSLVAAFIAGVSASSQWQTFLLYLKQTPFGEKDAIFGHDVGFYVFSVPMWQSLQNFVFGALIASLVLAAIMHVVMGGIDLTQTAGRGGAQGAGGAGEEEAGPASPFARAQRAAAPQLPQFDIKLGGRAVAHLSGILAAIFVVVGIGQLFRGWNLLYSTAGAIYGAAYTDVHIRLPLTYVTMGIAFLLAAVLVWNIWRRRQWWPLAIAVWIVALIVLRGVVPAAYQSLIVNPNQLTKERDYIANNLVADEDRLPAQQHHPDQPLTQDPAHPPEAGRQRAHPAQHPPVGSRHAGHELPAAAGTPAVLLVPRRRRRPLHGGRRVSPDDALAA